MSDESKITDFLLQKGFLEGAKPARGMDIEAVAASVQGREAEFGIEYNARQHYTAVFYRVKLVNPPRIPLFLWDKCPVGNLKHLTEDESRGYVAIFNRKWLGKKHELDEDELEFLKKLSVEEVRATFETLAKVAARIESGEIDVQKAIGRAKKTFVRELGIVAVMIAAAIVLVKIFILK